MNYTSGSTNYGSRSCARAADNCSRLSGGRQRNSRSTLPLPASHHSHGIVDALQETFQVSRPRYVAMAYSILRNKEDAEDAVQDAVLSAYLHLRNFEGRSAFTTWFTRIVLNAALMILRKRTNSRIESLPEPVIADEIPWVEKIPASQPDPETAYAAEETFQLIDVLLGKMSPVLRQAFTLSYYDEMSSVEAGALLGVTTGTFKSRLYRAKQHLRNQARLSTVSPIHKTRHTSFSFGNGNFQNIAAMPANIPSLEFVAS